MKHHSAANAAKWHADVLVTLHVDLIAVTRSGFFEPLVQDVSSV